MPGLSVVWLSWEPSQDSRQPGRAIMRPTTCYHLANIVLPVCLFAVATSSPVSIDAAENATPTTARPKTLPTSATAAESQRKQAKMKADMERKLAESKRKYDERAKALQPGQDRLREQAARYLRPQERTAPPPFNASAAPAPDECLRAFVAAGR